MSGFVHTPYDGSAAPFTLGLKPLDPETWIEADEQLDRYLDEKERLYAAAPKHVFAHTPASSAAQRESLALLAAHLPVRFPRTYAIEGSTMIVGSKRRASLADAHAPPLWTAARMVQEDLAIMQRGTDGWRLSAASLSFPSSWSLAEKFDRPMQTIHATVSGFGPGTRNAELIERIFDNLRPERPVSRMNWSIYPDGDLHHPKSKGSESTSPFASEGMDGAFIRVERQTLRRLPETGAILFTIRIYVDPLAALAFHGEADRLAAALRDQLDRLDGAQLDYKGLRAQKHALGAAIDRVRALSKDGASGHDHSLTQP